VRVHGGQEAVTEFHGGAEEVFLGTGNPGGLDAADTGNDIADILRVREEVGLIVGREIVLKRLPGEDKFIVFDVQIGGCWADENCLVNPGHGGHWLERRDLTLTGLVSNQTAYSRRLDLFRLERAYGRIKRTRERPLLFRGRGERWRYGESKG